MIHSWLKETGGADTAHTGIVYLFCRHDTRVCSDILFEASVYVLHRMLNVGQQ